MNEPLGNLRELFELCEESNLDVSQYETRAELQTVLRERELQRLTFEQVYGFARVLKLAVTEKDSSEIIIRNILDPKGRNLPKKER